MFKISWDIQKVDFTKYRPKVNADYLQQFDCILISINVPSFVQLGCLDFASDEMEAPFHLTDFFS